MELPTREQEDAVIAVDQLLTFMVRSDWQSAVVKKLIETKLTQALVGCEADEQAEALFIEAALKYIRGV